MDTMSLASGARIPLQGRAKSGTVLGPTEEEPPLSVTLGSVRQRVSQQGGRATRR